MMDKKLTLDEERRVAQYEALRSRAEDRIHDEVDVRTAQVAPDDRQEADRLAGEFRQRALEDVAATDQEVQRARIAARVSQIIDYLFFAIYALLAIRFVLALMAARRGAGFVQLITTITEPLYAPFRGIVASPSTDGGFTLALPILIAIIVYALLHAGINGLLRIMAHRKTEI